MGEQETAPRGRHAPPLEVRQDRQRARLFAAASAVFARVGLRRRDRRGDRARGRDVEGDVLRALRQQGGVHPRAVRRRHRRRGRGHRAGRAATHGGRDASGPCRRLRARVPRRRRRLPRPGADAAGRDHRRRPARGRAPRRRARRAWPTTSTRPTAPTPRPARSTASPPRSTRSRSSARSWSSSRASCAPRIPSDIRDLEPVLERLILGIVGRDPAARERGVSTALAALEAEVIACRRCPRLVEWREQVAREKRAAFRDGTYWGRPMPGFGDPAARVLVLGLAPAAHGGNRTGRDLHRRPLGRLPVRGAAPRRAREPGRRRCTRDDGLELRDCWITAAVRCAPPANKPLPRRARATARTWLERELALLGRPRVVRLPRRVRVGGALRTARRCSTAAVPRPRPTFGHGAEHGADAARLLPPEPAEHVHRAS